MITSSSCLTDQVDGVAVTCETATPTSRALPSGPPAPRVVPAEVVGASILAANTQSRLSRARP